MRATPSRMAFSAWPLLAGNEIATEGVQAIGEALKDNTSLQNLELEGLRCPWAVPDPRDAFGAGTAPPPPLPECPAYAQPLSPCRQVPASTAFVTDSNRPQPLWRSNCLPSLFWGRLRGPFPFNASLADPSCGVGHTTPGSCVRGSPEGCARAASIGRAMKIWLRQAHSKYALF